MRRTMALRDYLHVDRRTLTAEDDTALVLMPLANDFRVLIRGDLEGVELLFRGVAELNGNADPADTAPLLSSDSSVLDSLRPESGWIPAQPSGVRLQLVAGASVDVIVEYTSRTKLEL